MSSMVPARSAKGGAVPYNLFSSRTHSACQLGRHATRPKSDDFDKTFWFNIVTP
jgi:hypothetical protein